MAYDPATGDMVLFGGGLTDGDLLNDTWTWDGAAWSEEAPTTSPPGRYHASMAYDPVTGDMVLFGGFGYSGVRGDGPSDDTWTWSGSTWTERSPASRPPPRTKAAMAFDAATGEMVLFGGAGASTGSEALGLDDTWTWDGTTWVQLHPVTSPAPEGGASMVYDAATADLVLFGGNPTINDADTFDETWRWTGSTWTYVSPEEGYWLAASDGGVFTFGDARFYGSMGGQHLDAPVVGMAGTPTGGGYWLAASDGGVFTFGNARFYGSMAGRHLNAPIVGIAAALTGNGYWEVAADGGVFDFGSAGFYGSMGGRPLDAPIVGLEADPTGGGYVEVAADGGVFGFDASFYGSMGGQHLDAPIVGVISLLTGQGYWEVAGDGGVFSFGAARFYGSMGGRPLDAPIVGAEATPTGGGYWEVAADGGVFAFGTATAIGSLPADGVDVDDVVGMAVR
jgi:hypothetical protein